MDFAWKSSIIFLVSSWRSCRNFIKAYQAGLLLSVFSIFFFSPSLKFDFVNYDDFQYVIQNPLVVQNLGSWWDYLFTTSLSYHIPIPILLYKLLYHFFGLNPLPFHLISIVFHSANIFLVYYLARKLDFKIVPAFLGAAFFGFHPINAEVVCWITNLKTLLATFFALIALVILIEDPKQKSRFTLFSIYLVSVFALLSKPSALFLFPTLLLSAIVLNPEQKLKAFAKFSPLVVLSFCWIYISHLHMGKVGVAPPIVDFASWLRDVYFALGYHLGLIIGLISPDPMPRLVRPAAFAVWIDLLIPLISSLGIYFSIRGMQPQLQRRTRIVLGWFGFSILTTLNILPINRYLSDTFCYHALVASAWLYAGIFNFAIDKGRGFLKPPVLIAAASLPLILLTINSLSATETWRDGIHLFQTLESKYPQDSFICGKVGDAFSIWNQFERAEVQYAKCYRQFREPIFEIQSAAAAYNSGKKEEAKKRLESLYANGVRHPLLLSNLQKLTAAP